MTTLKYNQYMNQLQVKLVYINDSWTLILDQDIQYFNVVLENGRHLASSDILGITTANQIQRLVIDLIEVPEITSQGLTYLLDIQRVCSPQNLQIVLQNATRYLRRLFRIMQLDRVFLIE